MDLTTQTPSEIDEQIAEIMGRYYDQMDIVQGHWGWIEWYQKTDFRGVPYGTEQQILAEIDKRETAQAVAYEIYAERKPFDAEFTRRGGWTRAFLVDNINGHLHKSTDCSTCNNGTYMTRFFWVTDLSGQDESEIVDAAGETACTTCYPSAPVDVLKRPTRIISPDRTAREAAKAQRAAEKAARDAKKLAAAATKDGSELVVSDGSRYPERFKTERAATIHLVDKWFYAKAYGYSPINTEAEETIIQALADKHGVAYRAMEDQLKAKLAAKAKREGVQL